MRNESQSDKYGVQWISGYILMGGTIKKVGRMRDSKKGRVRFTLLKEKG